MWAVDRQNLLVTNKFNARAAALENVATHCNQQPFNIGPVQAGTHRVGEDGFEETFLLAVHASIMRHLQRECKRKVLAFECEESDFSCLK